MLQDELGLPLVVFDVVDVDDETAGGAELTHPTTDAYEL